MGGMDTFLGTGREIRSGIALHCYWGRRINQEFELDTVSSE